PLPPSTTLCPYTTLFRSEASGRIREIVTHWEGKPIQFNDMTPDYQGSLYAGIFGFNPFAHPRPEVTPPGTLFRIDPPGKVIPMRSEEHTSELQSPDHLVC